MGPLVVLHGCVWGGAACHVTAVVSQVNPAWREGWPQLGLRYRGGRDEIVHGASI